MAVTLNDRQIRIPYLGPQSWPQSFGEKQAWQDWQAKFGILSWQFNHVDPWKLRWNSKNEGLEDEFHFQKGDFHVPC